MGLATTKLLEILTSRLGGAVGSESLIKGVDARENWKRGGRDSEYLVRAIQTWVNGVNPSRISLQIKALRSNTLFFMGKR